MRRGEESATAAKDKSHHHLWRRSRRRRRESVLEPLDRGARFVGRQRGGGRERGKLTVTREALGGEERARRTRARGTQHVGHDQELAVRRHRGDGVQAAQQRDQGRRDSGGAREGRAGNLTVVTPYDVVTLDSWL